MELGGTVTVSGYTVISVRHKSGKSSKTSSVLNWWLTKTNNPRVISITGIPVYVTEDCVRNILSKCSSVKNIDLRHASENVHKSHLPRFHISKGYQRAQVEFTSAKGVTHALNMKYDGNYTLCEGNIKLKPMKEVWADDIKASYDIDTESLFEKCSKYMEEYDIRKKNEEKTNRKMADEPDEEGWITVTMNKFSRPPKAVKAHELKNLKKKKEKRALLHFYKNQVADSKMQRIKELKAKFEEDKKRIQEMRQQRKFKPY